MKIRLATLLALSASITSCMELIELQEQKKQAVQKVILNPTSQYMALISEDSYKIYDTKTNKKVFSKKKSEISHPVFLRDNQFFYVPTEKKDAYITRKLATAEETRVSHDNEIKNIIWSHNQNHMVINNDSYHEATMHDLANKKNVTELGDIYKDSFAFSPNSQLCAFYGSRMKRVYLYDLAENSQLGYLEGYKYASNVKTVLFPHDTTVIFSNDYQTYYLWNLENKSVNTIRLNGYNYARYHHKLNEKYFYWDVWENKSCMVYDLTSDSWFNSCRELPEDYQDAYPIDCSINKDNTYAVLTNNKQAAHIFATKDWKRIRTIVFDEGHLNPSAVFSPCGNFVILTCRSLCTINDFLKVYDIENNTIIFESPWVGKLGSTEIQFLKNNMIVFASDINEITMYNYKTDKKREFLFKKKIVNFMLQNKLLSVVLETHIQNISLEKVTLEDYIAIIIDQNEKNREESQSKDGDEEVKTKQESVSFYDHTGALVTQKLHPKKLLQEKKNGNCTIL